MKTPTLPRALVLLLLLPFLGAAGCRPEAPRPQPGQLAGGAKGWNVVLLSIDTLRADRLGSYGYERATSPHLDSLLAQGVRFDSAFAQRASTWPSLASVLTGLYPSAHGVAENGYGFPDDLPTLPKLLKTAGYRTGAFLSNMCKANHQGWDQFACSGGEDGKTVRRALEWAGKAQAASGKDRPFFLWVHLFGPHPPYYNGGDYAARVLDPGYTGPLGPKKWQLDRVMTERMPLTPRDVVHLNALYDAAVVGSDRLAGNLLDGLKAAGKLDRTVVVLVADHGEELYQHNQYLYHSCSVYQTGLHVPLGFVAPGLLPPGSSVAGATELIDVTPTLLALLGLAPPKEQHGVSLLPRIGPTAPPARPAFSQYGTQPISTVVDGRWKLVYNPRNVQPVCIPDAPPNHYPLARQELYDLQSDPGETRNVAADHPQEVERLARLIRQRFSGLTNRLEKQNLDEQLKEELKSLGYVAH